MQAQMRSHFATRKTDVACSQTQNRANNIHMLLKWQIHPETTLCYILVE